MELKILSDLLGLLSQILNLWISQFIQFQKFLISLLSRISDTIIRNIFTGTYGSRAQQQPLSGHRSHSAYSYQHSRTTTGGGSPSSRYREHDVPVTQTGMSSRASGERIPSG